MTRPKGGTPPRWRTSSTDSAACPGALPGRAADDADATVQRVAAALAKEVILSRKMNAATPDFSAARTSLRLAVRSSAPGLPPGFDDNGTYACASQNIGPGTQGGQRVGCRHENNPVRIKAEIHKAGPIKPTVLALALVLAQPENWLRVTGTGCQHQGETADGRMVIDFCGTKLVKRPARQPAPEPDINRIASERKKARPAARAFQTFETALQPRKRGRRIRHYVPIMF
ncbi:MAG: hypothetical protein IPO50_08980 [Sphingomonadales bacterium]|nr:hypothetical protein [Sphingomonadales bacterium]